MISKERKRPRRCSLKLRKKAGCHWANAYRSERDANDILWLMEWDSHDAFNNSGAETGTQFNELVKPAGEWDDVVWHLSDAMIIE